MIYDAINQISDGKTLWITKVTHPLSDQVYGYGESHNKATSRELAAKHALKGLLESYDEKSMEIEQSKSVLAQKGSHTEDNLPEFINFSDDIDAEFDRKLSEILFVQEHTLTAMEQRFKSMLESNLNTMTDFFYRRIQVVLAETVQKSIVPIIEKDVKEQVKEITSDTIKNEITSYSQ